MSRTLDEQYLTFLESQIAFPRGKTYWDLVRVMHEREFDAWFIPNDDNRIMDGHDVRIEWLMSFDGSGLQGPVSFLEVLIGLSRRLAFLAGESAEGWAWQLLCNLELHGMKDPLSRYKTAKLEDIMYAVIWRTYEPDGTGGFFPLTHPRGDQRRIEIWYQLNAYVGEVHPEY